MSTPQAMPLAEALAVIHQYRADAVVITTMGAAREWQTLEPHPKDLVYMPSSMGQGPPLGLGIANGKGRVPHSETGVTTLCLVARVIAKTK